jgi:hypothetical protein
MYITSAIDFDCMHVSEVKKKNLVGSGARKHHELCIKQLDIGARPRW